MNYHDITTDDMKNGEGLRTVLWLSGCSHHCKGCHNPITWDPDNGIKFDSNAMNELMEKLNKEYISGLTLSGGDPLYPYNRDEVLSIIREVKNKFKNKTIWLYTGFKWEELIQSEDYTTQSILEYIDVLVDGKFIENLKDEKYCWAGSVNQRIIDVQSSLKDNKIILYKSL